MRCGAREESRLPDFRAYVRANLARFKAEWARNGCDRVCADAKVACGKK